MAKYMLIIHEVPGIWEQLPPQELQRKAEKYRAWVTKLRESGRYVSGEKLAAEGGKILSLQNGRPSLTDGPYMETKEVLGGYLIFRAASYEEAVELIRDCPMLEGGRVALRQTDPLGCGGE
jgi:hypothetical protein